MAENHNHHHNMKLFFLLSILFFLIIVLVSAKYLHGKFMWNYYADKMQDQISATALDTSQEQALMLSAIVGNASLTKGPAGLQSLVASLSQQFDRDIVVMDTNRTVLADTIPANVDTTYTSDEDNEVESTIQDGKTRRFVEKSVDYPGGLTEVVVPLRDSKHAIIGAVILSSAHTK